METEKYKNVFVSQVPTNQGSWKQSVFHDLSKLMGSSAIANKNALEDPEIRSNFIITIDDLSITALNELASTAIIQSFDRAPIWTQYIATKRRVCLSSAVIHMYEDFKSFNNYFFVPYDDVVVIMRFEAQNVMEVSTILTVEPIYAGNEIFYSIQIKIFEGSFRNSVLINRLRLVAAPFGFIDYPDSALLDKVGYFFSSTKAISELANHPLRTQPLYLLPKGNNNTQKRKRILAKMAESLMPFGIIGEMQSSVVEKITGIELSSGAVCAIGVPPLTSAGNSVIVLQEPNVMAPDTVVWNGMTTFLNNSRGTEVPWYSPDYEVPTLGKAALHGIMLGVGKKYTLRDYFPTRELYRLVDAILNEPGWDLYSPLPKIELPKQESLKDDGEGNLVSALITNETVPAVRTIFDANAETENVELQYIESPSIRVVEGYPRELSELHNWVKQKISHNLVFSPRAIKQLNKVRHPNPERIASALELLAGPKLATFRGIRTAHHSFYRGLLELKLRDGFSNAEMLIGSTGRDYVINFNGRNLLLDRHLASNSSGFNDHKMIRIYYCYDENIDKIIIGWLPSHLRTSQS